MSSDSPEQEDKSLKETREEAQPLLLSVVIDNSQSPFTFVSRLVEKFTHWWNRACYEEQLLLPLLCRKLFGDPILDLVETEAFFANPENRALQSTFVRSRPPHVRQWNMDPPRGALDFLKQLAHMQPSLPKPRAENVCINQTFIVNQDLVWEGDLYLVNCHFIHVDGHIHQRTIQCTGSVVILLHNYRNSDSAYVTNHGGTKKGKFPSACSDCHSLPYLSLGQDPIGYRDSSSSLQPVPIHFAAKSVHLCELGPSTLPSSIVQQLHFIPEQGKTEAVVQRAVFWKPLFELWHDGSWIDSYPCSLAPVHLLLNYTMNAISVPSPSQFAPNELGLTMPCIVQCPSSSLQSICCIESGVTPQVKLYSLPQPQADLIRQCLDSVPYFVAGSTQWPPFYSLADNFYTSSPPALESQQAEQEEKPFRPFQTKGHGGQSSRSVFSRAPWSPATFKTFEPSPSRPPETSPSLSASSTAASSSSRESSFSPSSTSDSKPESPQTPELRPPRTPPTRKPPPPPPRAATHRSNLRIYPQLLGVPVRSRTKNRKSSDVNETETMILQPKKQQGNTKAMETTFTITTRSRHKGAKGKRRRKTTEGLRKSSEGKRTFPSISPASSSSPSPTRTSWASMVKDKTHARSKAEESSASASDSKPKAGSPKRIVPRKK